MSLNAAWEWFVKGPSKNKCHYWARHKGCLEALESGKLLPPQSEETIQCAGTKDAMIAHLKKCQFIEDDAKEHVFPSSTSSNRKRSSGDSDKKDV